MSKKKSSRSSASPSFIDQALSFVPKDMRKQVVKVTTEALKQTEKQRKVLEKDLAKLSKQAQQGIMESRAFCGFRDQAYGLACVILRMPHPRQTIATDMCNDVADLIQQLGFIGRMHQY